MAAVKWSFIFILVVFPLFLITGDHMANSSIATDAETATRSAVQAGIKANIVKNSLRDFDLYKDNIVVQYNPETIQTIFNNSITRKVGQDSNGNKGYITLAMGDGIAGINIHDISEPFPTGIPGFHSGGRGEVPPMLAIRTTVVREYFTYGLLRHFAPVEQYHGIQNQKIAILEVK